MLGEPLRRRSQFLSRAVPEAVGKQDRAAVTVSGDGRSHSVRGAPVVSPAERKRLRWVFAFVDLPGVGSLPAAVEQDVAEIGAVLRLLGVDGARVSLMLEDETDGCGDAGVHRRVGGLLPSTAAGEDALCATRLGSHLISFLSGGYGVGKLYVWTSKVWPSALIGVTVTADPATVTLRNE